MIDIPKQANTADRTQRVMERVDTVVGELVELIEQLKLTLNAPEEEGNNNDR
jgi:hypothetical protein